MVVVVGNTFDLGADLGAEVVAAAVGKIVDVLSVYLVDQCVVGKNLYLMVLVLGWVLANLLDYLRCCDLLLLVPIKKYNFRS